MNSTSIDAQAALTLEVSGDGVAWLVFDRPGARVNLLTGAVMARLDALLGDLEERAYSGEIRALVIRSGKPGTFIAGADVNEILAIRTEAEGEAASRQGQRVFRRLELLRIPTVAAVDGACLGGGTELILACGHRVASDRPETSIGLPEIRLGIIPGFGGTTRLPRLIGLKEALPLILSGRAINARRALRLGLVDEAVHPNLLYERAHARAVDAIGKPFRPAPRRRTVAARLLNRSAPGRSFMLARAKKQVMAETRGHYPAPLVALDVLAHSVGAPLERAFAMEARALGRLIVSPVSRNLVHVFQLMESAKKAAPPGVGARPVERAAVLGAGVMGGGIAQLLADRGVTVRLKDIRQDAIAHGLAHASSMFERAVQRGRLTAAEAEQRLALIAPTLDYTGFRNIDLVIEAVLERVDVKQAVLRETESRVAPGCVLTSNTSSLSITTLQSELERPGDFCGMHFFNPVHRMPLVEVIRGAQSSDAAVATVFALARRLDKTPIVVNDGPGFLVNRLLAPYLNEAGWLLAEGVAIEDVDRALLDFGMPMGPLRLLDEIGLDVARHAGAVLQDAFGERMAASPAMTALASTDWLGRKSGRGFYIYDGEKESGANRLVYERIGVGDGPKPAAGADEIRARTTLVMVNEAARVLSDGIVRNAGDVDLGMITGTGFPPFRGGPLRHAESMGLANVLSRLEALEEKHGVRFQPAPLLRELAERGRGFYA